MSTILVLEDDRELNQTMTYALEKEGYHVLSAYSCEEAKELSEQQTFHLAILDVNLPDEGVQLTDKHTLAVNINRLRKKIETEEHSYISNVYGMGYLWK